VLIFGFSFTADLPALQIYQFLNNLMKEKNMKYIIAGAAMAGLMVAGSAMATDMPALAKKDGCSACHSIDRKMVGPAWMDVSKKYKGDAGAKAMLVAKVSKGGSGNWGSMAMPPMDASGQKQGDIKELVDFILALAK
jgi:cytochrome c551/c552